jgi:regulator of protease activity HflC (stomatin/prohibitin superfamily)
MSLFKRSGLWRDVSPGGAIADFITVFRQTGPNRWRFAVLAALPPLGIFTVFAQEEARGLPPPPKVTYITSWRADRTDAEIRASNLANQIRKERLAADQARREEEVRQVYRRIGELSGIDVEKVEKQAAADRAAAAQAAQAEAEAIRRRQAEVYGARD